MRLARGLRASSAPTTVWRVPIAITDASDPRLEDYVSLTDVALRRRTEPERGLYIAESQKVIRRALAAGHRPRSYLMAERWVTDLADLVDAAERDGVPVYVAAHDVIEARTGFHLHRGALASMQRPELPTVEAVVAGARRVVVLEDVVDHTNVGAIFRSAARARRRGGARRPRGARTPSTAGRSASRWARSSRCPGRGSTRGRRGS